MIQPANPVFGAYANISAFKRVSVMFDFCQSHFRDRADKKQDEVLVCIYFRSCFGSSGKPISQVDTEY